MEPPNVARVTKLAPLRFKNQYFTVTTETESFRLHKDLVAQHHLEAGSEISEEKLLEIRRSSDKKEAMEYAYLFLSYRGRTEKEMDQRLKRKGFSDSVVDEAIEELKRQNFINDASLARDVSDSRLRNRGWGKSRVKEDLIQKGVDPGLAEKSAEAAEAELEPELRDEEERAFQLLLKRREQLKSLDDHTLHRRLFDHLVRRGYSFDVAERALSRYKRSVNFGH